MNQLFTTMRAQAGGRPVRLGLMAALLAGVWTPALAASDVVISQVYGGGGNSGSTYKNDFIEIFNRGTAPVDVSNWSVQYASAAGANWAVTPLPSVLLQAGQYLLVQQAQGSGGSTELPEADASGAIAMSSGSGKVLLSNASVPVSGASPGGAGVLDLVGFGAAGAFEGSVAPGPSNTMAIARADNGCADSDDNGRDFAAGAPAPRNRASEPHVCGAPVRPAIVATCPALLSLMLGQAGGATLHASDLDGMVNRATIASPAVTGIALSGFVAAAAPGERASVRLTVGAGVAVGSYPVVINFGNDQDQSASCSVNVTVQVAPAVTRGIAQIQGEGATSAYANTVQTTEGVVTLKVGSGFFMQDPAGDGNPASSDAIFVFTGAGLNNAAVGDLVRVTGTVTEFTPNGASRSVTEFKDLSALITLSGGHSVAPTNIALPFADLGQVEAMLVRFTSPLTVSQSEFVGSRGELSLSSGRREVPTNRYRAGSTEALALAAANARNLIVLDDGKFVTPSVIPYIGEGGTVRAGDSVADLTGVVDFGAIGGGGAAFKLQPTVTPRFSRDNPRAAPPHLVHGNVKVASANVLNFFTTFTNGADVFGQTGQGCTLGATSTKSHCRGADNLAEFVRQRDKIVAELIAIDADVVGLMEIQNNGETAVSYLVDQLNAAAGAVKYAYVPKPAATGSDAIRVAMLYKPARVTPVGAALSDAAAINNRPPMAQTFMANNGEKFSLIVNHLKSKGSCPNGGGADADQGDGQGCWNATRVQQAQRLMGGFVPRVTAAAGDPDVLIIGDLNSHGFEDPINAITDAGFVNQLERFVRPTGTPYSFIFDSEIGYLDHALASAALSAQVADAAEWHVNADEPSVIDYNIDGKPQDWYNALPYRASDHDPVVISLNLRSQLVDVGASMATSASGLSYNRVTRQYAGTFSFTNTGSVALRGPFTVRFDALPPGVKLVNASGVRQGVAHITVNQASLAPGASVTFALSFNNPRKALITYATQVYSGTF
ncbi:MAG: ExeM/NucH family extracellular endonuclease [Pseudomonadota bacterium]